MVKKRELTPEERNIIVEMRSNNMTYRAIAEATGIPHTTVQSVIKRYTISGTVNSIPRKGRRPILSTRDLRKLKVIVTKNRRATLSEIKEELPANISTKTIGRMLIQLGYRSRKAVRKPFISKKNAQRRLLWCKLFQKWTLKDWKRVIWSDECSIQLWQASRDLRIRRTTLEQFHPDCVAPTVKHGGGSLMVWACFNWDRLGPIIVIEGSVKQEKYIEILENHLLPFWKRTKRRVRSPIFQDDGAPAHTARSVATWKRSKEIRSFRWPAQSPDLNPIEHLWQILKTRIQQRNPRPKNLYELKECIYEEWSQLDPSIMRSLVSSMTRRIRSVIIAKGYQTKY
jgi:transposase